jgi:ubiquinone/menaquinone biosynthesis C-methylase UbiE
MNIPGRWHHPDEIERRKWQNPEAILKESGLKPGMTLIDLGCGEGFFTIPAARYIGLTGKVYGVDVDRTGIQNLQEKARAEGLTNIELIAGTAEETGVCSGCADIVFLGIVLHDFENPPRVLVNTLKMLKPGGRLVNLDWKKENMNIGPPLTKRFDEVTAARLIESAGFKIQSTKNSGQFHYLIIATPDRTL